MKQIVGQSTTQNDPYGIEKSTSTTILGPGFGQDLAWVAAGGIAGIVIGVYLLKSNRILGGVLGLIAGEMAIMAILAATHTTPTPTATK